MSYEETLLRCSQMLEGKPDLSGAGRKMDAPLLSVFLGEEAQAHMETVASAYRYCWSDADHALACLETDSYTPAAVEEQVSRMLATRNVFHRYNLVRIAYFWDIMGSNFDAIFAKLQQPLLFQAAVTGEKLFFLFYKETTTTLRKTREERLKKLLAWAAQEGEHLVLLSDTTIGMGNLGPDTIDENYRLAANIMLIVNSVVISGESHYNALSAELQSAPAYSAGYFFLSKNTRGIATASLWCILDHCKCLPPSHFCQRSVRDCLCGELHDYEGLFEEIFTEKLSELLPQDHSFLRYLPYTEEMRRLEEDLTRTQKGFGFARKNTVQTVNEALGAAAIASIAPIWDACIQRYYSGPIMAWLSSASGKDYLAQQFRQALNNALTYGEMTDMLLAEAAQLQQLAEKNNWQVPENTKKTDLAAWLHRRACRQLKADILYQALSRQLGQTMEQLQACAQHFGALLEQVKQRLRVDEVERSVRLAYEPLMDRLVEGAECRLIPCSEEGELLDQLECIFRSLVEREPKYRCSLSEDLKFRMETAGSSDVNSIISNCFTQDMVVTGRLKTYTPPSTSGMGSSLYCMLSTQDELRAKIGSDILNRVFDVPRKDCIERLLLYRVEPSNIIY